MVIGILLSVLSESLTIGPSWTVLAIVIVLMVPMIVAVLRGHHRWTRLFAFTIMGIITLGLVSSVSFLIYALFAHTATAAGLFRDAGVLWAVNIAVFAVWYWEVDQGGPARRYSGHPERSDFLFPQVMSGSPQWERWTPAFLDYLYLAFNTNTAFSPTDTMVLSKRAKLLMMMQSSISLLIVAVLAARAINIA
ncbi:hypothetical protein SD70_07815 [Gordoniibacillus kamchatkensis]|uniref:DUF1345 domain-containing protein n=1 Tax=Gordoniibacillus kamchatkensis TaxID=1590651 RepID=A0ABR5AKK1_9BACL|nr:hypothetical protein SD70_07815 [Paenibacillus sp. VKM B-2647]